MKAGTCGDYSNLLVSVLLAKGFDACYAYIHRDCYGHAQDHICAAVNENGKNILIDASLTIIRPKYTEPAVLLLQIPYSIIYYPIDHCRGELKSECAYLCSS